MKRVLLVSPYYPPSTLAGVHRARFLARYLPAYGWEPTVLCVDERDQEETLDPELGRLAECEARIVRCRAWSSRMLRPLGIGDVSLRGYLAIGRAISRELAERGADALLVTSGPFYTTRLGVRFKRTHRLPFLVDFQDPWVSRWGAGLPGWSKGGLSHRIARYLEPGVVRAADAVVSVSEGANAELRARYAFLAGRRMAALPIGGDPRDFEALARNLPARPQVRLDERRANLCYVGTLLPRAGAVVDVLLRALALLRERRPALAAGMHLHFVGTSNQPDGHGRYAVRDRAAAAGVAELVTETPQRVSYLEALSILSRAHGLLLLGSDEPHYTASKIYPAVLSGRPLLGLFHRESSAHGVLAACGGALLHAFASAGELEALVGALADDLARLVEAPHSLPPRRPEAFAPFTASHIAGQFAALLDAITGAGRP